MVSGTSLPQNSDDPSDPAPTQKSEGPSDGRARPVGGRGLGSEEAALVPAARGSVSFGSLAKKIASRTTDLLAIAIVLTVGLSVGGSLVDWWRTDPEETLPDVPQPVAAMNWGEAGRPVALRFGREGRALSRQTVAGDRPAAETALRAQCRRIVEKRFIPSGPPDPRERQFLASLQQKKPIETKPGQWRLYRINAPVLMVVGIGERGDHHPSRGERVLCWGVAFPTTSSSWVLYTFTPSDGKPPRPSTTGEIPLPPRSRRILSVRDRLAGRLCLFVGRGPPAVWMRYFDEWFETQPGGVLPRWHQAGERWWTRGVVSENGKRSPRRSVEIVIQRNAAGQWAGIVSSLTGDRKRGR